MPAKQAVRSIATSTATDRHAARSGRARRARQQRQEARVAPDRPAAAVGSPRVGRVVIGSPTLRPGRVEMRVVTRAIVLPFAPVGAPPGGR